MKIGFDISQTGSNKAGCGYFADSLIQTLTGLDSVNDYILYPHFGTSFWDPEGEQTTRRIDLPNVSRKRIGRDFRASMRFWSKLPQDAEERLGNPDIIHSNNYTCPLGLRQTKVVYTLYDLGFLEYPELTTEENRCKCFEGVFGASIFADFVIPISFSSRNKFLEIFPHYPVERIQTVYLGSRFSEGNPTAIQGETLNEFRPGEFWLAVGTIEPRKNLRRLLKAFSIYKEKAGFLYPLVFAGGKGWLEDALEEFVGGLGLTNDVRMLGYVSDEELAWLYSNCFSFVYPSLYEGFGLPVLEAMGMGAAVITSHTTSLPEVGGQAVHYINPFDENDIVRGLQRLFADNDYRQELKRKALVQARRFSWEKSAAEALDIYRRVIDMPKFGA